MRANKNETAYKKIKNDIVSGKIDSDVPISESMLVDSLKLSRTPIRAALQRLQAEGFIRIIPNQGIVIRDITLDEANEMYELRSLVEIYMIRHALPLLTQSDIAEMRDILDRQREAGRKADYLNYLYLDVEFHVKSYCRYRNTAMINIIVNYKERVMRSRIKAIQYDGRMENGLKEHEEIVRRLESGNMDEAIDAAILHINKGARRALGI